MQIRNKILEGRKQGPGAAEEIAAFPQPEIGSIFQSTFIINRLRLLLDHSAQLYLHGGKPSEEKSRQNLAVEPFSSPRRMIFYASTGPA